MSVTLAGCGGGSSSSSPGAEPSGGSDVRGGQPVASKVVMGSVAGNVQRPNKLVFARHRKALLIRVGKAVDTWIDGAFVGVGYPRNDFHAAFRSFTAPAAKDARHQQSLTTNWDLRHQITGVAVKKRTITIDVLAPHGRPAGATARVGLVFTTTGDVEKRVSVHARLFLSRDDHGTWQIFGYDVAKGGTR
jgi:hypothetical protein